MKMSFRTLKSNCRHLERFYEVSFDVCHNPEHDDVSTKYFAGEKFGVHTCSEKNCPVFKSNKEG